MHKAPDRVDPDTGSHAARPAPASQSVVPATLVVGFRGAGKDQLIDALLRMRPSDRRWTLIGPGPTPPAVRSAAMTDFQSLPAGCMCCTGLVPFRAGLTQLLRQRKLSPPARLIIDAGAQAHARRTRAELGSQRFVGTLKLTSTIAMIDADLHGIDKAHAQFAIDDLVDAADIVIVWSAVATAGRATPAMRDLADRTGGDRQPWFAGNDNIDAAARAALDEDNS